MQPEVVQSQSVPAPAPLGGVIAGRYRVEGVLGRGGMGSVYRVTDLRDGRALALKRVSGHDPARRGLVVSLFEREYHSLAQLAHPRIVEVYDYGIDASGAYYTMELLDGIDLRERGKLPWREACFVLRDVASSLALLHSRRLLHRDVSPRNVRCTSDGRAKLLDFGAMTPMGVPKGVVGTPPLVPPEALQQLALDGRSDLYALGGLAYWALTGRYAYPVRHMRELRDFWRTLPAAPHRLEPSIPADLSSLVMELLHLDRMARPATAAEVIERLDSIAEPPAERNDISLAYLTTPSLVGRDEALARTRRLLIASLRGHGATLMFTGASGIGRSRFLDAFVLEAKLLGATVLRADQSDGAVGDYGVLRALGTQLLETLPEHAHAAAGPHRQVLATMFPALAPQGDAPARSPGRSVLLKPDAVVGIIDPSARRHLQVALRDWLLAVARQERIAIALDDAEEADEPSLAVLSALAHHGRRRRLSMALSVRAAPDGASPLSFLRERATLIELTAFTGEQTEELVRSLFGDVPNVVAVAGVIHDLSQGNPGAALELAQHLLDRGLVRYEAGHWVLPEFLPQDELPRSLDAARSVRIASLSKDARSLGQLFALSGRGLTLEALGMLALDGDLARTYRALDDLVAAEILQVSADRYRFKHEAWSALFVRGLPAPRARELHASLARAAQASDDRERTPYHLMRAGKTRAAIDYLMLHGGDGYLSRNRGNLLLLEEAIQEADELALPKVVGLELRSWLIGVASVVGDHDRFSHYAPAVLRQLRRDCGLSDWDDLAGAGLPPDKRLEEALSRAQLRHDNLPESLRGFPPIDAIQRLGRSCATFASMVGISQDASLLRALPPLAPLLPLSPALLAVDMLVRCIEHMCAAQWDLCRQRCLELLAQLERPESAALDLSYHTAMRLGMLYMLGIMDASQGHPDATRWVAELETVPGYRANAWRVHRMMHLMQGDAVAAAQAARRSELFGLQDGEATYPGTSARVEAFVHWTSDDLMGVKASLESVGRMAERFPAWRPILHITRCHYHRLRGDHESALEEVELALCESAPGVHPDWPWAAQSHVQILTLLERHDEAVERAREYYRRCIEHQCLPVDRTSLLLLAQGLAAAGQTEEAVELAERSVSETAERGCRGLILGMAFEVRARIALQAGDRAGFFEYAGRCAQEYKRGQNVALTAKYERLMQEARHLGMDDGAVLELAPGAGREPAESPSTTISQTLHSRLLECVDAAERASYALGQLLESTGAGDGLLCGLRGGALRLIASFGDAAQDARSTALVPQLAAYLARERRAEEATATEGFEVSSENDALSLVLGHDGCDYRPVLLMTRTDGETVIAAVAALRIAEHGTLKLDPSVLSVIAAALVENDDVDPLTCLG